MQWTGQLYATAKVITRG